jgi:hypothetical protein
MRVGLWRCSDAIGRGHDATRGTHREAR